METRVFVNAGTTISHQPTFGAKGFSKDLGTLVSESELVQPVYKSYIDPVLLRRMSRILRMGVASSLEVLKQAGVDQPSAIIVGTGLGCLQDTEKFLQNFLTLEGLLPPTSFILSTHNTVAGQISLSLGCNAYNITHTQNSVSFEMALLDGVLKAEDGTTDLLVGAADEAIPFLETVALEWGCKDVQLTSGASFFVLSPVSSDRNLAEVADVLVEISNRDNVKDNVLDFLGRNGIELNDIDLLLGHGESISGDLNYDGDFVNYVSLCGLYPTASAFAFHYAVDLLETKPEARYVLIVNQLNPDHLGLVLLRSVEA